MPQILQKSTVPFFLKVYTQVLAATGKSTFKKRETRLNSYSAFLSAAQSETLNSSHLYFLPSRVSYNEYNQKQFFSGKKLNVKGYIFDQTNKQYILQPHCNIQK